MAFEPFGYFFEVEALLPPTEVKAVIRSRKKTWFDAKNGPRGWIVGPFICLWFSAFDRYGPMLFGRISRSNLGTKISGRAGSDLNGLAMLTLWLPLMALILVQMVSAGDYTVQQLILIGGIILLSPLAFWWAHKDRRDAEPLVRFIRGAVTPSGHAQRSHGTNTKISDAFGLSLSGDKHSGPVTTDVIHEALLAVGPADFVIMDADEETYIQTAFKDGGYILERRDGDSQRHFRGLRRGKTSTAPIPRETIFTFEEVCAVMLAYASEAPMPQFIEWDRVELAI